MARILVGMSGGVDSSMAAYLLKAQGHDVIGVSFILCNPSAGSARPTEACRLVEPVNEARRTAHRIGIEHIVVDLRNPFFDHVVEPFIEGYRQGVTPNPCVLCNRHVKFPFLGRAADERGADLLSTGHYARVLEGRLLKGLDPGKDQSYVLYGLTPDILRRLTLPLGALSKPGVRAKAE